MSSPSQNPNALMLLVQQLQQELQNQRSEIISLRESVAQLQNQIHLSQNAAQTRARVRLPDPPKFDGKPHTLRTWLPSIRAKLRSDQLDGADAFDYVWDRLEQPQQASILHLREQSEEDSDWDPEQIFSLEKEQLKKDEDLIVRMRDHLTLMREVVDGTKRRNDYLKESIQVQVQMVYALLAQQDNALNHRYGADMRVIAAVTLLFLPGTFVATLFSPGNQGPKVSSWVWLYWVVTEAPPEHAERLGDRLAEGIDFGFIPQGLQHAIKNDLEVGR
ncbi:uncharacterized protein ALTATR162_LOCUS9397 [Alternaria atra]|uniref:Uncharacterized protein n=1 Tax=Alternaria atra TaxID=119953 RepID=A0A8J2I801_9PLEO|nr:uncharacterized protein ALTATR162_LOCUS9397 [Alternaria atra]CAG5180770.1 unnamed protein product [Alternaria atra]